MSPMPQIMSQDQQSAGGRLIAPDGRQLAFRGCSIEADACGGLAEVTLRQSFYNDSDEPLQVIYQVPLPTDAAVGGYSFRIDDRRVVGEIESREEARKRFEDAVLEGRSAALLEHDRSSLFTQEIGNIPPRTTVECELVLDQKLRWLQDGQWEWRFPTVVAPRYMGDPGRVTDQNKVFVDVLEHGQQARADLELTIRDPLHGAIPTSPSHLVMNSEGANACVVKLQDESGAKLDSDIVIRWPAAASTVGAALDLARTSAGDKASEVDRSAYGLLTITPPGTSMPVLPRDVILLIDTSASMLGGPMEMARDIALGLVQALGSEDTLEMISFSMQAHRWEAIPKRIDARTRESAVEWIRKLGASGGTEMQSGFLEGLKSLRRNAQRQVILLTDGLVGFEQEIVGLVHRRLPERCRVHTVGIGPAANRSLTGAVARAGGGEEFLIGLDEDPQTATDRIVQRVSRPLLTNVTITGSALRKNTGTVYPDLAAGAPSLIPIMLDPEGGELIVRGEMAGSDWVHGFSVPACEPGTGSPSIARLFGRECAEHLEMRIAGGERLDHELERIGLQYRIATRRTSWVAISEEPTVDQSAPIRRVKIAQSLPAGLSAEGLGVAERYAAQYLVSPRLLRPGPPSVGRGRAQSVHHFSLESSDGALEEACEEACMDVSGLARDTTRFVGILRSLADGRAVIEIELFERLFWDPERIVLRRARKAAIGKGTTGRGRFQVGQTIRLVITDLPKSITIDELSGLLIHQVGEHPDLWIEVRPA